MGHKDGSPPLYLVTCTPKLHDPKLARAAALRLEESRLLLIEGGHTETVQLLDIVLLQLRMELRDISEAELKALCAAISDGNGDLGRHRDADGA